MELVTKIQVTNYAKVGSEIDIYHHNNLMKAKVLEIQPDEDDDTYVATVKVLLH